MSQNTVIVITGANSGLGLGLVKAYLQRPSTSVVGVVRSDEAQFILVSAIHDLKMASGSTIRVVVQDFSNVTSLEGMRKKFIRAAVDIEHVSTLICSAGTVTPVCPTLEITPEQLRDCFQVNAIAPLTTFQVLWPLMERSVEATGAPPKFIVLSSSVGSIGAMEPLPGGAYGPSKAAVNHIVKSLHEQMAEANLVSIALHPGWVKTRMGDFVAKGWNYAAGPPDTIEDSVEGILKIVDEATRETTSGKFITQKGIELPW